MALSPIMLIPQLIGKPSVIGLKMLKRLHRSKLLSWSESLMLSRLMEAHWQTLQNVKGMVGPSEKPPAVAATKNSKHRAVLSQLPAGVLYLMKY